MLQDLSTERMYQILTPEGQVVGELPDLSAEQLVSWYRWMIFGRVFSDRLVALQRQGRMGTFTPFNGQEAASLGLAAPLQPNDWLAASYRETLSYLVRGVSPLAIMEWYRGYITQRFSRETRCLPLQVVLAAQTLHGVGIAMALKYENKPEVAVTVCGDGATSEPDFNDALNFAGVFKAPIVFIVQNNGWAISVPKCRQTAVDYIACRGVGFGLPGCVVDGNDLLAVYQVVADAVARARAGDGPTLIEAITYRMGAHSTADDPTKYRSQAELQAWAKRDPIARFRTFLLDRFILDERDDGRLCEEVKAEIQDIVETYEALPPQNPAKLFESLYADMPPQLQRQQMDMVAAS